MKHVCSKLLISFLLQVVENAEGMLLAPYKYCITETQLCVHQVFVCLHVCVLMDQCSLQASQGNNLGSHSCLLGPWIEVVISSGHVACSHSHALESRFSSTHALWRVRTHTNGGALMNPFAHMPTPSPEWSSRRACLCQQMSGRRCVFLCLSLQSFHPLLQRRPICLWPCFILAPTPSPPHTPNHLRVCHCVCCDTCKEVKSAPHLVQECINLTAYMVDKTDLSPSHYYSVLMTG